MSATHNRPPSHRLALIVCLVPIVAAGCSKEAEKPVSSTAAYGSGIVSMEIVQRDMASRRAQAAPLEQQAAPPAASKTSRFPLTLEPRSRTGLVPVSTRGVIRTAPLTPIAHAKSKSAPLPSPATETAPPQADAAANLAPASTIVTAPIALAPSATVATSTDAAPIFPSATVAARKLGFTGPTAGAPAIGAAATPAANAGGAPAFAGPAVVHTSLDEFSRIYSKDDAGVTPARLLTTTSTAGLSVDATDVNTMELVINQMGRVEQVKLAAPAKRMTDMLLLSGAKMWKFEPATKDGLPVRYRTQVSWQTTR